MYNQMIMNSGQSWCEGVELADGVCEGVEVVDGV